MHSADHTKIEDLGLVQGTASALTLCGVVALEFLCSHVLNLCFKVIKISKNNFRLKTVNRLGSVKKSE